MISYLIISGYVHKRPCSARRGINVAHIKAVFISFSEAAGCKTGVMNLEAGLQVLILQPKFWNTNRSSSIWTAGTGAGLHALTRIQFDGCAYIQKPMEIHIQLFPLLA